MENELKVSFDSRLYADKLAHVIGYCPKEERIKLIFHGENKERIVKIKSLPHDIKSELIRNMRITHPEMFI